LDYHRQSALPYGGKFWWEKTLANSKLNCIWQRNLIPAPSLFRYYKQLADKILANRQIHQNFPLYGIFATCPPEKGAESKMTKVQEN